MRVWNVTTSRDFVASWWGTIFQKLIRCLLIDNWTDRWSRTERLTSAPDRDTDLILLVSCLWCTAKLDGFACDADYTGLKQFLSKFEYIKYRSACSLSNHRVDLSKEPRNFCPVSEAKLHTWNCHPSTKNWRFQGWGGGHLDQICWNLIFWEQFGYMVTAMWQSTTVIAICLLLPCLESAMLCKLGGGMDTFLRGWWGKIRVLCKFLYSNNLIGFGGILDQSECLHGTQRQEGE